MVRGQPRQIVPKTPSPKYLEQKQMGGLTQGVEHLLRKCEALSSNPSPTKKKKKCQDIIFRREEKVALKNTYIA
jgi:hypothetical protein